MSLPGLALAALFFLVPLGLLGLFVWAVNTGDARLPRVAVVLCAIWIAVTAVAALFAIGTTLFGEQVRVSVPIEPFTPVVDPRITPEPAAASILEGGLDRATVLASGLSPAARGLLAGGTTINAAMSIAVAAIALRLARSLRDHDPFRLASQALLNAGAFLVVGGLLAALLTGLGEWLASQELFAVYGFGVNAMPEADLPSGVLPQTWLTQHGWPAPAMMNVTLPFWPLAAGLGLALVAAMMRAGEQLRRDTEGLV